MKQLALQKSWDTTGNLNEDWINTGESYVDEMKRHKAQFSSESRASYIDRSNPLATSLAHNLPTLHLYTQSNQQEEICQNPMSKASPGPNASLGLYSDCVEQIGNDELPFAAATAKQATLPDYKISPSDEETSHPTIGRTSNYPPIEGPLERYLAQDDYVPNADDPQGIHDTLLRLRSLRANALQLRSVLRTKRKLLGIKQSEKLTADEAFMRFVREHKSILECTAFSNGLNTLNELFKDMQDTRDVYGPLQDDCDEIERALDDTEFEMGVVEGRIHRKAPTSTPPTPSQDERKSSVDETSRLGPTSFLNFGPDFRAEYHPLHSQYLSRLGDLDLASERLHNLGKEHHDLLSSRESKLLVGRDLDESLQALLAALPEQESRLEEEIVEIEKDVDRLYSDCLAAGINVDNVDDADDILANAEYRSEEGIDESVDILEGIASSLSDTSRSQSTFTLPFPRTEDRVANINRLVAWLLHFQEKGAKKPLATCDCEASGLQVNLVYQIFDYMFEERKLSLNTQKWLFDVLHLWAKDEANKFFQSSQQLYTKIHCPKPKVYCVR